MIPKAKRKLQHLQCLLQHITVPIPISGKSYLNIGPFWVGLVPPENYVIKDIMVTYRKPPSLKDRLVRAKIPQPKTRNDKGCTRPNSCQYCTRLSQSGRITNLNNNTTYNTITKGTCQSNNLIYCLGM